MEFVHQSNVFEYNSKIVQVSGTDIGSKFAPHYECIFFDKVGTDFLSQELLKPLMWLRYINDVLFEFTHGMESLDKYLERIHCFHPNIKIIHM